MGLAKRGGREGLRIERAFQFARWRGGRSVAWSTHRREIGRGAAYGGLFFDRTVGRERLPSTWRPQILTYASATEAPVTGASSPARERRAWL